jgi:drug/metabolite transporter (DMT)-like permease
MNAKRSFKSPFLLLVLSLVFASDLVAIKFGISGSPPLILAGLRYFLSGLILLSITVAMPKSRLISRRTLAIAMFLGGLATIEFTCLYLGMQYIGVGETSILYYTHPIFVAGLATFLLKESFSWRKASALLLGFLGILLLFAENLSTGVVSIGGLLVLASAFAWALGIVVFKRLVGDENYLPVTSIFLLSSGALLLTLSLLSDTALTISLQFVLVLAYLIIVCSAFGIALYYYLLRHNEVTRVSTWLFLVPAFGVLLGWLFLGESIRLNEIIGIACVAAGIVLLNR